MDVCVKFNETSLPKKKEYYSHLNVEDVGYTYAKIVCKGFKTENVGEDHNLYFESDTLLLADVFENFWSMCLAIYEVDSARFLTAPGLAWLVVLKKQIKI